MADLRFGSRRMPLPASRAARIALGGALIVGGVAGFLPILGFWMLPLGLLVLSVDLPAVRRWRRRTGVWWGRRGQARAAARAAAAADTPPAPPGAPVPPAAPASSGAAPPTVPTYPAAAPPPTSASAPPPTGSGRAKVAVTPHGPDTSRGG
jgi:hypothetical protein